ncbi:GTP pyrophosphokinase family protein [Arthrobacter sp. ISL-95]|uniref:GTP pyrophosphokinase n=1 Tax=Arthrobacter sp. ISL-95 TaxID=2819116 RepID=UPI001BEBA665|nr:hypothetical protein [Arthrobacter sp. ISL-95]MBT2586688.1 hypothetical protein [Arthrobacter sp. ISL-95]
MGKLSERWLAAYRTNFSDYELAAAEVKSQIEDALRGSALNIHLIEARAKEPDSVAEKVERRGYGRPGQQFDDLIGVRIITLFDHSVGEVAKKIRSRFSVDEGRSSDKTSKLILRQVGYRSNHLVIKASSSGLEPVSTILRKTFVEIQVRSVIAHAWAEIEHSLRYKVGEGIPPGLARRFDALAGTLELVDREFSGIETATVQLVLDKSVRYLSGQDLDDSLSTIQVLAALRVRRPEMKALGPDGLPLPIEDGFKFAKILVRCGIMTVQDLLDALINNDILAVIRRFANTQSYPLEPEEASGIVVIGSIVGSWNKSEFQKVAVFQDPKLVAAFEKEV